MSIKDKYTVRPIESKETYEWLLHKHYAKRIPPISYAFGLFDNENILQGVCTFGDCGGSSKSHNLFKGFKINELNRLCINQIDKNQASFFISQCLKLLPSPMAIVSYADSNMNHHGYIYQATNWLYCGKTSEDKILEKDGIRIHRKTFYDKFGSSSVNIIKEKGYNIILDKQKYRYFYFIGDKKQKKEMLKALKYPILPYPKGDNKNYDASYETTKQGRLF